MQNDKPLIMRLLQSDIKAELLALFHNNPGLVDSIPEVARRIGRTASMIKDDVEDLVDIGILRKKRIGRFDVIFLDHERDREVKNLIAKELTHMSGNGVV